MYPICVGHPDMFVKVIVLLSMLLLGLLRFCEVSNRRNCLAIVNVLSRLSFARWLHSMSVEVRETEYFRLLHEILVIANLLPVFLIRRISRLILLLYAGPMRRIRVLQGLCSFPFRGPWQRLRTTLRHRVLRLTR